jgi:YVTN family beta-propeller protein
MAAFNYIISVTGDCQNTNSGSISLFLTGGSEPYTVEWIEPNLGVDIITIAPSVRTSLSAYTYSVRVNDSSLPTNEEFYINIPVSSGVCANILGVEGTTCSLNNGSVTGSSSSNYSSTNFYLYDSNDTFITSAITNLNEVIFGFLSAGTYYMAAVDLGGCTGYSQNFIVEDSDTLDFGLYTVPNSGCGGVPVGKITITGLTGTPPYTYSWSTSATGTTVTGLTSGTYSVSVTDSYGCVTTKSATIVDVPQVGLGAFTAVQPTCFAADGSLTIQITGGTAPYYYSASTGDIQIQYGTSWTVSGLSPGNYSVQVTDAALCTFVAGTVLTSPQGITSINISSIGSTCSSNGGSIQVSVFGGTSPYLYTIIYPNGNTTNVANNLTTQIFSNLASGTYSVAVQDASGCSYIDEITLFATNTYTISTEVTGTTCNQDNGSVLVTITEGGASPYDYSLDDIQNVIDTTLSAVTFTNVASGQHTITVTDATGCTQTTQIYVNESEPLDFTLYSTSCGEGSDGTLTALISTGTPPFTFNWSSNVQTNPQQIQVTGLTADTYSLTVVDSVGCSLTRSALIDCQGLYVSYQTYVMGSEQFSIQSQTKYGLLQMLNEGFDDLTNDKVSCDLLSAVFGVKVSVNPMGLTTSQNFFTGTTLVMAPSDNLYYDTVKDLLLTIPGIGSVTIDALNNQITVTTEPGNTTLNGQEIIVELTIVYDIMCLSCDLPTITPTLTPTITPTPAITLTSTPTNTVTPTQTKTPTPTAREIGTVVLYTSATICGSEYYFANDTISNVKCYWENRVPPFGGRGYYYYVSDGIAVGTQLYTTLTQTTVVPLTANINVVYGFNPSQVVEIVNGVIVGIYNFSSLPPCSTLPCSTETPTPTTTTTQTPTPNVTRTQTPTPTVTKTPTPTPTPPCGNDNILTTLSTGGGLSSVYDSSNNLIYVSTTSFGIMKINPTTNVVTNMTTDGSNSLLLLVGNKLYARNNGSTTLKVFDITSGSLLSTIILPSSGGRLSYSTLTNMVYCQVNNGGLNQVAVINNTTYATTYTTLAGGLNAEGDVFVNPSNNYLYVVESTDNQVRVFDLASSFNLIATISVGSSPLGIAYKQTSNIIFVTNRSSNTISVINCTTNTVTTTYSSASFNIPWTITYNDINDNIYVGNNATVSGNYLQVILDSSTGSFVKSNDTVSKAWWSAHNTNNNRLYVPQNGGSGTVVICCST